MRPAATLLLALIAKALTAQHSGFGIKGGLLMSDTKSGAGVTSNLIPGATAGGYFALRAGPRMEIQPEVSITSLGAGYTLPDGERSNVRVLYAQVPLSVKLFAGNVANVQAGFQMGRLLMASQSAPDGSTNVTSSYRTWDYGLILGAGADMISGLDVGLRYYNGLRPILKEDQTYFPRNRAYMLTVGYRMSRIKAPKLNRKRG
ncbi:MAG: PorT family protein [Flavobacteriales bacterium]|nr:PorT family protein [Flavobacteriales bacterium]